MNRGNILRWLALVLAIVVAILLAGELRAQTPAVVVTRADSLDARCATAKLDTLKTANGVGARRNLATTGQTCVSRWLNRLTGQKVEIDTVVVIDTVPDVDTIVAVPTAFVRAAKVYLDTIDNDAGAPAYSIRNQLRLKASIDSLLVGIPTPAPPAPTPGTNAAPVARFTTTVSGSNPLVYTLDASQSTDDKAVVGYQWDCDIVPACNATTARFTVTYPHGGPREIKATVRDAEGRTSTVSQIVNVAISPTDPVPPPPITPPVTPPGDTISAAIRAEPPRVVPSVTFPKALRTKIVAPPMDFQAALDGSQSGDSLVLAAEYIGNFVIPNRSCGAGISVTAPGVPLPIGVRQTPTRKVARLVTPNNAPALKTNGGTCQWKFDGIEITGTLPITSIQYGIVWLGDGGWLGGGEIQTTLALVPQNIVFSHMYIHGSSTLNSMRCLALNSGATVIRDSWFGECHASGFDSQAIVGWNGPGPYLIENNFLEGAGENVMFGGADPGIPGLVPRDITVRGNHFYKPLVWKGGAWSIKNLFELKTADRLSATGNVFDNNWPAAQEGVAIVLKSNANGCQCDYLGTRNVTFDYNIVRNAPVAFALSAADNSYGWTGFTHTRGVTIEHNFFDRIGVEGRASHMMLMQDLKDVIVSRNTFRHAPGAQGLPVVLAYTEGQARRLVWRDNVMTATAGYVFYGDQGKLHAAALDLAVADRSWNVAGNVIGGVLPEYVPQNPPGNIYLDQVAKLGLLTDGSFPATSPYQGKGADFAELGRRTAGVASTTVSAIPRSVPRTVRTSLSRADSLYLARQPKSGRVITP